MTKLEFVKAIQKMVAIAAIGPSALRGQGAPGVIEAARSYLTKLDLRAFATGNQVEFNSRLDAATEELRLTFPTTARNWGAARKGLNLFLRDSFYNRFLCDSFRLQRSEKFFEIPLDGVVARELAKCDTAKELPRWKGIKYLDLESSRQYQSFSLKVAKSQGISRVHLDTILWVAGRVIAVPDRVAQQIRVRP